MNRTDLANLISEYSQTMTSKVVAVVGGTSAVSKTSFGDWLSDMVTFIAQWPNMEMIANLAIILLVIERLFICWSWFERKLFPWFGTIIDRLKNRWKS